MFSDPLDPLIQIWERGEEVFRCHSVAFGATEFNPGLGRGRFHPLFDAEDRPVPTLYGAGSLDGALSETVFHSVPVQGSGRQVRTSTLAPLVISSLLPLRDLRLAQLHGYGLRRLGVTRSALLESEADTYGETVRWAAALHRAPHRVDGLVWVSRQHDTSLALILFGDRVQREDLLVCMPTLPLAFGAGLERVRSAAEAADITLVE